MGEFLNNKDNKEYLKKRAFYDRILTIYGRNAVLEALEDRSLDVHKLHLSSSNKPVKVISQILKLAEKRELEVLYHDKVSLSRISKNSKQDQGVALDIAMLYSGDISTFGSSFDSYRIIALDGVTNPQNIGMIIRSCAAGNIDAILLPQKGNAKISPLVIKASAGTLFKLPILKSKNLIDSLKKLQDDGAKVYILSLDAENDYKKIKYNTKSIFVLGNESNGVSEEVAKLSDEKMIIPMNRNVESLNVAVTAALLAFI